MQYNNANIQIDIDFSNTCNTVLKLSESIVKSHNKFCSDFRKGSVLYYPGLNDSHNFKYNDHSINILNGDDNILLSFGSRGSSSRYSFFDTDVIDIKKNKPLMFGLEQLAGVGGRVDRDELLLYYAPTIQKFYLDNDETLYDNLEELHFQLSTVYNVYNLQYIQDHIDLFQKIHDAMGSFQSLYICDSGIINPDTYHLLHEGLL